MITYISYLSSAGAGAGMIEVPAGELTITGYAPTVIAPMPFAQLVLTPYAPTIKRSLVIPSASLVITGYVPVVSSGGACSGISVWDEYAEGTGVVPPDPLPDPPKAARTDLLSYLTVSGEEDFESYAVNDFIDDIASITVNGVTATITTDPPEEAYTMARIASTTAFGRFNTTPEGSGSLYLNFGSDSLTTTELVWTFSEPISVFWLYLTDVNDFAGAIELTFVKTGGGETVYTPTATVDGSNGSLNFFAVLDCDNTYDAVRFRKTNIIDQIGIDGVGWATFDQIG